MAQRKYDSLLGSTLAAFLLAPVAMSAASARDPAKPLIAGHRGGAMLWPENTLPGLKSAANVGVEILEFDMNLTADDQVVVKHDTSVNADVCDPDPGSGAQFGPIRERTLAELRKFDCGSKQRPIYPTQKPVPGARIPTLDEVLKAFRSGKQLLFAETKMPAEPAGKPIDPHRFAKLVNDKVRKYGVEKRFILQSSDYRTLDAMHQINPRIRTCLVRANRYKPNYLELAHKHHAGCAVIPANDISREQVRELHAAGIWVFGDVADTKEKWREHVDLGVYAIITNDPVGLKAFLKGSTAAR